MNSPAVPEPRYPHCECAAAAAASAVTIDWPKGLHGEEVALAVKHYFRIMPSFSPATAQLSSLVQTA
jgi:hypothetical protein